VTGPATTLAEALMAAATGAPRRYVITGGPSSGKDDLIDAILAAGIPCMEAEPGREVYRKHRERLGRHLLREDRREYSLEVLQAFVAELTAHKHGIRFYSTTAASPMATAENRSSGSAQPRNWKKPLDYTGTTRYSCLIRWTPLRIPMTSCEPRTARSTACMS
jgi:AAA domain-containing protein